MEAGDEATAKGPAPHPLPGWPPVHDQRPSGRFFFGLATAAGFEPATLSFEG